MKALQDLFSTDYGLMSFVVIAAVVVGLGVAYVVLKAKMAESAAAARPHEVGQPPDASEAGAGVEGACLRRNGLGRLGGLRIPWVSRMPCCVCGENQATPLIACCAPPGSLFAPPCCSAHRHRLCRRPGRLDPGRGLQGPV